MDRNGRDLAADGGARRSALAIALEVAVVHGVGDGDIRGDGGAERDRRAAEPRGQLRRAGERVRLLRLGRRRVGLLLRRLPADVAGPPRGLRAVRLRPPGGSGGGAGERWLAAVGS